MSPNRFASINTFSANPADRFGVIRGSQQRLGEQAHRAARLLDAVAAAGAAADFSVLTGTDSMLVSYLLHGARGTICANANLVPELVLAVYEAARAGKLDEALRLEARLRAVSAAFGTAPVPAAYKAAAAAGGVGERWLVPPRQALTDEETARLLGRLAALDVRP